MIIGVLLICDILILWFVLYFIVIVVLIEIMICLFNEKSNVVIIIKENVLECGIWKLYWDLKYYLFRKMEKIVFFLEDLIKGKSVNMYSIKWVWIFGFVYSSGVLVRFIYLNFFF